MSSTLYINSQLEIPESELHITASRSSGPGGQHVNTTSSKVTLRWSIAESQVLTEAIREHLTKRLAARLTLHGELVIQIETTRSQMQNREIAHERLADIIQKAFLIPKRRIKTKPKKSAKLRRLNDKSHISNIKRQRKISAGDSE